MRALQRILPYLRPYRLLSALSLLSLATLVLLDLTIPRLVQRIIDEGVRGQDQGVVLGTAALMLVSSALSALIAIGNNRFSVLVGEGVARDLRADLFERIMSWSAGNLDRQKTGMLMVRLTSDVAAIKSLVQISLRIGTRAPLLMVGSLVLMVVTSPRLALQLLPLLAVTAGLIAWFVLDMEPMFRAVQGKLDALNTVLQENIAGVRVVRALVRASYEASRFQASNDDMTERSVLAMQRMASMTPALTTCINVGMVVVVWSGGIEAIHGDLTLGQVVAFTNYLLTTMTPLVMMTMLSNMWAAGVTSARRVVEILDTEPEIRDAPGAVPLPPDAAPDVRFDGVGFAYDGDPVLEGIDLVARPGETVAILGATGSGTTTLVSLIPRLYDPDAGEVRYDGHDLRTITQGSLLARVALVPQATTLFSGTIRENITYGRPDATDDEVVAAAQAAEIHEFILGLPGGYSARVQPRGANLSGGQKQRLAIARALILRPDVLVLDDATASVDTETETRIQRALAAGDGRRTTFVVAQRISTVLGADRIVVLDRGRIVAQGTHRELLESSAIYQEIYESQLGSAPT